jgi:hypothetical protein
MLQTGSLLLKLVVVVLQHLDQLCVVLDLLVRVELNCSQINAIVVRNLSHLAKSAVLRSQILELSLHCIDSLQALRDLYLFDVPLFSKLFNALNLIARIGIPRIKLEVLRQAVDLVLQLFFPLIHLKFVGVKHRDLLLQQIIVLLELCQLHPLLLKGHLDLRLDDDLHLRNRFLGVVQLLSVLVPVLNKRARFTRI